MPNRITKEERLESIQLAMVNSGLDNITNKIIFEYFNDKYKKEFEEAADEVLEILELILRELGLANSRYTIFINNLIAMGLKDHEFRENWSQLNQIHRSLPNQILAAIRDEQPGIKSIIVRSVELTKAFDDLSLDEKEKLIGEKT